MNGSVSSQVEPGLWAWLGLGDPHESAWMVEGLCAQTDPELFFPEQGCSSPAAQRVCLACPVRERCLEYAVARPQLEGIWGGRTPVQRRALRRERSAA